MCYFESTLFHRRETPPALRLYVLPKRKKKKTNNFPYKEVEECENVNERTTHIANAAPPLFLYYSLVISTAYRLVVVFPFPIFFFFPFTICSKKWKCFQQIKRQLMCEIHTRAEAKNANTFYYQISLLSRPDDMTSLGTSSREILFFFFSFKTFFVSFFLDRNR